MALTRVAIIDAETCDTCRQLDGMPIEGEVPVPPEHCEYEAPDYEGEERCRCVARYIP